MEILLPLVATIIFAAISVIYNIFNFLFGFSDDNCDNYEIYYEREIRYEEPPF